MPELREDRLTVACAYSTEILVGAGVVIVGLILTYFHWD